jgi:hypothetical protein
MAAITPRFNRVVPINLVTGFSPSEVVGSVLLLKELGAALLPAPWLPAVA